MPWILGLLLRMADHRCRDLERSDCAPVPCHEIWVEARKFAFEPAVVMILQAAGSAGHSHTRTTHGFSIRAELPLPNTSIRLRPSPPSSPLHRRGAMRSRARVFRQKSSAIEQFSSASPLDLPTTEQHTERID